MNQQPTIRQRKIDVAKAIKFKAGGASYNDIGKRFGTNATSVHKVISPLFKLLENKENIKTYRDRQPEILDSISMLHLANAADARKIKKATAYQSSTIACQLIDKSLLLQGKATANINIHS